MSALRKIIHVDMDAFYVSVEIRDKPELAQKPVAVGGKANSRGVLSTCNYIARKYGVRSAMPNSVALRKCPDLIILPGRMEVYKSISAQLRSIFLRYTDKIEPLSLDEAYLDVTHCTLFNGSATLIAQDIRHSIFTELNLTASAGIAPVKFLAKVASDLNKPNGQFVITPNDISDFIKNMPLNKIPGVGKVTFEKLKANGFETGKDIIKAQEHVLVSQFGRLGVSLWQKCHGIDNREVEVTRVRKSVGVERTFAQDVCDFEQLSQFMHTTLIPELKRRANGYINTREISKLGVKVKFKDFQQTTKEFKFQHYDSDIFTALLKEAISRGNGKAVRLLGVHIGLGDETKELQQIAFELG
ncbi:DNA polymerase IV [Thalassotalea piscium]|uniref:DNA polymerase IV n=1 Tax=Thalassotalea piscium TaxID=1230533 RepID=A0A7X0TTB5_9GAMM|nr:DNA polymerase IV [Thalassotalea piscium]MBB6542969.1 DNA polymerase-4 [Thalassotalea piscium]